MWSIGFEKVCTRGDTKQRKQSTDEPTWNQFGGFGEVEKMRNCNG
jgi:hypothetical protein